ncbi:sigma-54 interaction domain-containing protein [Marinomonas foliarum]|uniref:Sigma-54-specific transcriptional regulator n=1 Tax=Marinomonas foliarum TaxID=491950 RepID=A0A368ZVK5_9GAMM|nr:sigma-54 dependent transcriptional regulator [Marinomonas foliarum]RCX01042.1 sigma-54-specific transcriptional regulator [Marinomonas foliarum]
MDNTDYNTSLDRGLHHSEQYSSSVITFSNVLAYKTSIRASALVFQDKSSRQLCRFIERIAPSNATVLIRGETGTGKELVAREIHRLSNRADKPFVAINCGAIAESLIDSELFGHEKGAFTGATSQKKGWFEAANHGTLFLDEIGDLPLADQVKLLRVLQEQEIVRVGSRDSIHIDVRIIAATNVALHRAVENGRFRKDLFYRLNVAPVELLPLCKRQGDILPLVSHFIDRYAKQLGMPKPLLSNHSREKLLHYSWPGNIRELENVIHRALLVMNKNTIEENDLNLPDFFHYEEVSETTPTLPKNISNEKKHKTENNDLLLEFIKNEVSSGNKISLNQIEKQLVKFAYEHCHYNQIRTGEFLGLTRNVIRYKLKKYGFIS